MKAAIACEGKILVVGDGDFSFTVAMVKYCDVAKDQVFTSNLETDETILHHAGASQNMTCLQDSGVLVFLGTDARDLHNHPVIGKEKFDRIIFNFPLADRHNIKKNRSLLADFFSSCKSVLAAQGQILVTLCKGQGGTPADQPVRSWHDSWQIVAMATNASFLLHKVFPFDPSDFPEYNSVGFRFQDKSFNLVGAVTHIFEEGETLEDWDQNVRGVAVRDDGETYSCSSYVASCLRRNFLLEPRNPVYILNEILEHQWKQDNPHVAVTKVSDCVIPSHKSAAYLHPQGDALEQLMNQSAQTTKGDKNWKNSENMKRLHQGQLKHGVAEEMKEKKSSNHVSSDTTLAAFLPETEENVFILVKTKGKPEVKENEGMDAASIQEYDAKCVTSVDEHIDPSQCEEGDCAKGFDSDSKDTDTDKSLLVFHCRTSLLENLPQLCNTLNQASVQSLAGHSASSSQFPHSPSHQAAQDVTPAHVHKMSSPCLMASGQCLLPCSIAPGILPTKHELLILHRIAPLQTPLPHNQDEFELLSSKIVNLLHRNVQGLSSSNISLSLSDHVKRVNIEGIDETQLVHQLTYESSDLVEEANSGMDKKVQVSKTFGFILKSKIGDAFYHIALIHLDILVCHVCRIEDPRVLWSLSYRFLHQFQPDLSSCLHRPVSLYPLKFVHDLSFWEKDNDTRQLFDVSGLFEVVRNVAGDLVTNVSLVDVYEDPKTNKRSRCYRLFFMSYDKCLPYVLSWKLQSQIRMEVSRRLGVQLR